MTQFRERELVGLCAATGRPLYEGDKGTVYDDGEIVCEEFAPTVSELIRDIEEILAGDLSTEDRREFEKGATELKKSLLETGDTKVVSTL